MGSSLRSLDTVPLVVASGEWEEWGNPNEEKYYDYMREYSPYDNVTAQEYPVENAVCRA